MGAKRALSKKESELPLVIQRSRKPSSPQLLTSGKFTSPVSLAAGTGDASETWKSVLLKRKTLDSLDQYIFTGD
ncbi:MAG: hypothetical protein CL912_09730 [Deltaproteobacteria bacterium]|nr:hypothetical protein [Deltaproteobacteria bacterium]